MLYLIVAVIIFIIMDLLIRAILKSAREKADKKIRMQALETGLKLDFSQEAKSLKRVEVEKPKARILCVDDERIILDSFRFWFWPAIQSTRLRAEKKLCRCCGPIITTLYMLTLRCPVWAESN